MWEEAFGKPSPLEALLCQLLLWHSCKPLASQALGDAFTPLGITSSADPVSSPQLMEMELLLDPDSAESLNRLLSQELSPAGFGSIALSPHSSAVFQISTQSTGECCPVPSGLGGVGSGCWVTTPRDGTGFS